jgi:NADPH:quinone reductase-like Zn-dependent oxidoreductase
MKAIVLEKPSKANELKVTHVNVPKVKPGWVLVKIKAFGINRSELFTRNGQSPSVKLPRIIGIECVGEIEDPSDSTFIRGQRIISMMGDLGRAFDGSYAEFALIPTTQVYPIETDMDWVEFAAIPEMYYTAWGSLVDALKLQKGETLLIRGATSSVGLASIQIAKAMGVTVAATTRNKEKTELLHQFGADLILVDDDTIVPELEKSIPNGVDKILELVGTTTLQTSFKMLKHGGILCMSGILGGSWALEHFAPMDFIPSGSYFTIFDSQNVSLDSLIIMFAFLKNHHIKPPIARVFTLDEIADAHRLMEQNTANGKIVVVVDDVKDDFVEE